MAGAPARAERVAALDTLRAVAILWVVMFHASGHFLPPDCPASISRFMQAGFAGVDLFFALSGYLIASLLLSEVQRKGDLQVQRFLLRRWLRTLPAYFAILVVVLELDETMHGRSQQWGSKLAYLFFLQPYANADMDSMTLVTTWHFHWSWSLCVEEWFYLSLPLLFVLLRRRLSWSPHALLRCLALAAWGVSITSRALVLACGSDDPHWWFAYWVTHCRFDAIAAGVLVATWPPAGAWRPWHTILALLCLAFGVHFVYGQHSDLYRFQQYALLAVAAGVLVYLSTTDSRWSRLQIPGARRVADLSYSIYLVHPIMAKMSMLWLPDAGVAVQGGTFLGGAVVAALVLRNVIELPFLQLRKQVPAR